ncbi:MAG: hypothetical protein ACLFN8_00680 [Candidatus Woesearchaeota archaeon]
MKNRNKYLLIITISLLFLFIQDVSAVTYVSNSNNWEDVYSVLQLASLNRSRSMFITNEAHARILHFDMALTENIRVISSRRNAYIANYRSLLRSAGIENVEEERLENINLELAGRLPIRNFIIIDPAYSYNAIAVAPYAFLTNSYVLFANRDNLGRITSFLDSRDVNRVLLYGTLQREVREGMQKYNPEIINENGDKFLNNIEITKRALEINNVGQVLLTNGEFIEQELIISGQPILFVGRNSVPPQIAQYIRSSPISVGVLVGNELINSAQTIRTQTGISTIIKFGRGARVPDGAIMGEIEALDMFYLPPINISLELFAIRYNKATNKMEITLRNTGEVAAYASGSYTIRFGQDIETLGDEDEIFIDAGETKTFTYSLENRYADDNIFADLMILFGESANSLEYLIEGKDIPVEIVEYDDASTISITDFYYDLGKGAFAIEVRNPGTVTTYVSAEIIDFYINFETKILSSRNTISILPGKTNIIYIDEDLIDEDFINNPEAKIRLYYGEQENILVNLLEETWPLVKKRTNQIIQYAPYAILIILLILILTSNKKCKKCGTRNPKRRKHCKKCNAKLK